MISYADRLNETFGHLTAIKLSGKLSTGQRLGIFQCTCGETCETAFAQVVRLRKTDCGGDTHRLPKGVAARGGLLTAVKGSAKKRGYEYAISDEFAFDLFDGDCHYCGRPPSRLTPLSRSKYRGQFLYNGIDRVNNSEGYIIGNVVSCCSTCNYAKRDMPYLGFLDYLDVVTSYRLEKRELSS